MLPKPLKLSVFITLLWPLMIWVPQALAVDVNFAWNATTTNTNGTLATDLAGYRLYCWQGTGTPQIVTVGKQTPYATMPGLVAGGTYTCAVAAYNTAGSEGVRSDPLTVTVNRAPTAAADTASVTAGTSITITVLTNDTDADGNTLSITTVTQGAHGTVTITSSSSVVYTPAAGFVGTDLFTYTISDGRGGTATASVSVNVLSGNSPPVASTDTISVPAGTSITIAVLANDADPNGNPLSITAVTQGAHGTVTVTSSRTSVVYTPASGYVGADSFTYTISDGQGGTATATVTVTVLPDRAASLVAAYNFNEGSGSSVTDASGYKNTGTVSGATWTTSGKFGTALRFNDSNARVTMPHTSSLQLTTTMTLEAWVFPTVSPTGWRAVIEKHVDGYYLMASSNQSNRPAVGGTFIAGTQNTYGTATLPSYTWTHLAATFDGATVRLYVNGAQVASQAQTTSLKPTTGTLQIGSNSSTGENFVGRIDEVRIYNTVLSRTEIQADMITPIQLTTTPQFQCPCSLWNGTTPAVAAASDASAVELGVKFRAEVSGFITALRFYKGPGNNGPHVGNLWSSSGARLASVTFTNETATGWQQMTLPTPVAVTANTTYVVSYHTPSGHYAFNPQYFSTVLTNSPLLALASSEAGGNGVYRYGASSFPNQTYNATNYWVDVVFTTTP